MNYAIYSKDLSGYKLEGWTCLESYERDKKWHLDPNSLCYGDKLVSLKRVKSGISIRWTFYWRRHFYWKPQFSWKYSRYFHWLWFMLWIEDVYCDEIDKIVADHLEESRQQ